MTHPTNTDLADALREIANTMPLGSALVLRLAADRLTTGAEECIDPDDGWIEWDSRADGAGAGPELDPYTRVEVRLAGRFPPRNGGVGPVAGWAWAANIVAYRVLP